MFQMPKIKKLTRNVAEKFGGGPNELRDNEPCTYREMIQYFYFLQNSKPNDTFHNLIVSIADACTAVWGKVNPSLPLLHEKRIYQKIRELLQMVKDINRKRATSKKKTILCTKLDKLFDISACHCELPNNIPCNDRRLKCKRDNCPFKDNHTICTCESHLKVPNEVDRIYLWDQRNKVGPKGRFQLGNTDKSSI